MFLVFPGFAFLVDLLVFLSFLGRISRDFTVFFFGELLVFFYPFGLSWAFCGVAFSFSTRLLEGKSQVLEEKQKNILMDLWWCL